MSGSMRAALWQAGCSTLEVAELPEPRARPREALVRVRAAGICGTDLGFIDGLRLPPGVRFPIVLGHEVAGEVVEAGEDAGPWRPGDRVIVNPYVACAKCRPCRAGRRSICADPALVGLHRQGGFAELLAVPATNLHRLPANVSFGAGAIIPDAVGTAYHALVTRGGFAPGEGVAIFGAGGVGSHAVMLAKLLGASPLIVVVRREVVAGRVRSMGADVALAGDARDAVKQIRRLTDGGVDLALDFVGKPESVRNCLAAVRIGGRAVLVGVSDAELGLMASTYLVRYELDIRGAFGADPGEIDAVLALVAGGRLDLGRSVSREFPLSGIQEALSTLRDRAEDVVRLVVIP